MTDAAEVLDACDDVTPREVWQEYEHLKARLDRELERALRDLYADRDAALNELAEALGCGVPPEDLSPNQQANQQGAVRKWRSAFGSGGCRP